MTGASVCCYSKALFVSEILKLKIEIEKSFFKRKRVTDVTRCALRWNLNTNRMEIKEKK
jgi:hypothetical protein